MNTHTPLHEKHERFPIIKECIPNNLIDLTFIYMLYKTYKVEPTRVPPGGQLALKVMSSVNKRVPRRRTSINRRLLLVYF